MKTTKGNKKPTTKTGTARSAGTEMKPMAAQSATTIEARIDVGFGNNLFVRGEGAGLSWDHGVPLACVNPDTWRWSTQAGNPVKFKLLLNDAVWSHGDDLLAAPGQKVEVAPRF